MLIERVEVSNYRSLKSIDLNCDAITSSENRALLALLGRNGTGKSSVLYALDVFYDIAAHVTTADCYGQDADNEIVIRVTYGSLRLEERDEFRTYIENDRLIVTKRIQVRPDGCIQKYYAAARQIPQFAELRKLGKRDRLTGFKQLMTAGTISGLVGNPRSAEQVDTLMNTFEAAHPDLLVTMEREEQFFGPKEIGGGKLDKFTKFVLVPAVRSAADEEQRRGIIYELINMIVLRQVNKRADVLQLRAEMKDKVEKIFNQENLTELGALAASISVLLKQYSPGASLRLTWGQPVTPEIPLPKPQADLVEDDFPCPITYAGHGLQRGLILTLLQYLARTGRPREAGDERLGPDGDTANITQSEAPAAILNPDLILAIEEPELYLHPARCRYLSELFMSLSRPPASETDPRNQILYATHSPYFVDLHRFDHIRIARKPKSDGLPAPCCVISQFSLNQAAQRLAEVAQGNPEEFTRDSFRARSLPVMTTAMNEGFFANAVVVVEGLSDVGVFWRVQQFLEKSWEELGIVIVPALGKENLDRPVIVFRGLHIPTYFVFDGDARHRGKKEELQTIKRNARYQRLAGVTPVDFPQTQVYASWAVFENNLETTIKVSVGEEFQAMATSAMDELKYDEVQSLMKNTEGAARLTELIYERNHRLPVIEEIVEKITDLSRSHQ